MKRLDENRQQAATSGAAGSSTTSFTRFTARQEPARHVGAVSFASLAEPVRLAMGLIARQAKSPDDALEPIIDLLVRDEPAKRDAIITAFRTNEPLREQWLRTYEILRG